MAKKNKRTPKEFNMNNRRMKFGENQNTEPRRGSTKT